jgi:hypothetical protein
MKPSTSQLKSQRNELRAPKNRRQVVGSAFIGPLPRGTRRANRTPRAPGFTEQRIEAPVASSVVMRGNSSTSSAAMPFPLRRKEYVGDIAGSVALTVTKYSVNPGLQATFPWAGGISPSFEEYDTKTIAFHYEPESSSSATGTVIISFDYDAADVTPTTKQQLLTFSDNVRAAPWVPCTLVLKLSDLRKRGRLYVRNAPVPSTDIKTYDLGNVYIATSGQANTANIGEFWISYDFPHHTPTTNVQSLSQHITGATPTTASFLGTQTSIAGSTALATIVGNVLTFNYAGKFMVVYIFSGTSQTMANPILAAGAVVVSTFVGNAGVPGFGYGGTGTSTYVSLEEVTVIVGSTLTYSGVVVAGSTAELFILPVPVNQT